jgi:cell surface hyaluronidase
MYRALSRISLAFLLVGMTSNACADPLPVFVAKPALPTNFSDGGFESPAIGPGQVVQNPASPVWTFTGTSGYAANGSLFAAPAAPDGTQLLYLLGDSAVSQSFVASTGRYRIAFKAAQRIDNNQSFALSMDAAQISLVNPSSTNFQDFAYDIDLTAGTHTLNLQGQVAGNSAVFLDSFQIQPIGYVAQGGFDQPAIPPQTYVPAPTPSAWNFTGLAGIAANGSPLGTPLAVSGTQVLYITGTSTVSQTLTNLPAARMRLSLQAAQIDNGSQAIKVLIDSAEVGTIKPTSAQFSTFTFDALKLSAGSHTLSFVGQTTGGTVLIDDIRLLPVVASGLNWSSPDTWDQGAVPGANAQVVIPVDALVLLDGTNLQAKTVTVEGELHCKDQDLGLSTQSVMVYGRLVCGAPSAASRYVDRFTLTLLGLPTANSALGMGNKVLGAMGSGVIELHGEQRISWLQLNGTANAGQSFMTLSAAASDWRIDDEIVIAPTREDPGQGERRKIKALHAGKTQIELDSPLSYTHYGLQHTYASGANSWTVDERAEVGLLSRNIRIVGGDDASPADDTFGGHVMTMQGTTIHASGIELYRMGQKALKGRYPFHWHLVGNAPGQYIENSSVHASFNRCITVHQTNQVRVVDNVCFDFVGHGYFLEDGNEQNNTFDHNLAVTARRPVPPSPQLSELPLETDYRESAASNGPAAFWISHPNNTYTNNAVAGSEGTGYWYHLDSVHVVPSLEPTPNLAPFGTFENNRVRSSRQGFSSCLFPTGMAGIDLPGAVIRNLSVNHTRQAIWPCSGEGLMQSITFERAIAANSRNGMQAPHPVTFENSLFVAYTPNTPPLAQDYSEEPWFAVSLYDQGFLFDNVHFVNYHRKNMSVFLTARAAHKIPSNRSQGLTFDNSPNRLIDINEDSTPGNPPSLWGDVINDIDGSLTGMPGHALVPDHPLMSDATCKRPYGLGLEGYACPYRYSHFRFELDGATADSPRVTILRSDGEHDTVDHRLFPTRFMHDFIANGPYRYSYRFEQGIRRNDIWFWVLDGNPGDTSVHELMDVPPTFQPYIHLWSASLSAASSLDDLNTGAADRYFYRPNSASLFIKLGPQGNTWFAHRMATICMTALVNNSCEQISRSVAPPEVNIISAAAVPAAGPFTLRAEINSASKVTATYLFIDDVQVSSSGPQMALPYVVEHPVTLSAGNHVVKLTVHNAALDTYTAIQRLVVGEPAPRIAITNLVENGTYPAATVPALQYQVYGAGMLPRGAQVRWLDNGVDKGVASGGSIALGALPGGKHTIEVAVADSDGSLRPILARKTIYLVKNNLVADFESGVDARSSLRVSAGKLAADSLRYGDGVPRLGTEDNGADDFNYLLLPTASDSSASVLTTYKMDFSPAQDWSIYQKLQLIHHGPGFELYAHYTNGGWLNVGLYSSTAIYGDIKSSLFTLPPRPGDSVTALELRYRKSDLYCSGSCPQLVGHLWSIQGVP